MQKHAYVVEMRTHAQACSRIPAQKCSKKKKAIKPLLNYPSMLLTNKTIKSIYTASYQNYQKTKKQKKRKRKGKNNTSNKRALEA